MFLNAKVFKEVVGYVAHGLRYSRTYGLKSVVLVDIWLIILSPSALFVRILCIGTIMKQINLRLF